MRMKKKIIQPIYIALLFFATSCLDDVTSLNNNPKAYQSGTVPAAPFFSSGTRNLVDVLSYGTNSAIVTPSFSAGITFKILSQQFAETTYFDAISYNLTNVGNGFWVTLYRDVLLDYKEAKMILEKDALDPVNTEEDLSAIANQLAIIEIMEVYVYSTLVNTYGDVPYSGAVDAGLKSEALDSDNLTPAYDDAASIYNDLFTRLDAALGALNEGAAGFDDDADLIYGGDVASWAKFGNSLKLKMALTLADVDEAKAKSIAESAAPNVFESNADNALLVYKPVTPNTNPIWVNIIQSEREDFVASNTMIDLMKGTADAVDDPRIPLYYTVDNAGGYSGGIYGRSNSYVTYSKPGEKMTDEEWPGVLLDYAEVEFYLAEAATRGYAVGGTSESHYVAGIEASLDYWGASDATAFLADPTVAFATASGTDLQKIARQKYIALFNRGLEAWTEYRRLDYPEFKVPPVTNGDFPIRYTYPNSEQTSNGENYTAAAAAIGGDVVTNKVFWDIN
jgi:hypothetical protein